MDISEGGFHRYGTVLGLTALTGVAAVCEFRRCFLYVSTAHGMVWCCTVSPVMYLAILRRTLNNSPSHLCPNRNLHRCLKHTLRTTPSSSVISHHHPASLPACVVFLLLAPSLAREGRGEEGGDPILSWSYSWSYSVVSHYSHHLPK